MSPHKARFLVLAFGNDILGDDAAGLIASRMLKASSKGDDLDFVELPGAGFDLLQVFEGYECALVMDAIMTGDHPVGSILELSRDHFRKSVAPSLHYAGVPEVFELAEKLHIPFPRELRILALEVKEPYRFREGLSRPVELAVAAFVERARDIVKTWRAQRAEGAFSP